MVSAEKRARKKEERKQRMNNALLSSQNMNWCTPQKFFDELNAEFHFTLDAAATEQSAKCDKYFTPETDGLKQSWSAGGRYFATHRMDEISGLGYKKHIKNRNTEQQLCCSFRRARTHHIFTISYTEKPKSDFCAVG